MPQVEILAYSPIDMEEFEDFFVNGKRDAAGNFIKDDQDRLITGVLAWLHGREIPQARFFSSTSQDTVQVFVSVIEPTEDEIVPWMRRVPGFHEMVRSDGQIGLTADFSALTNPIGTPLDSVKPRPDLDAIFVAGKKNIDDIDFSKRSFSKEVFLDALKGVPGANVGPMLAEIKSNAEIEVLEDHPEFRVRAATV